MGKYDGTLRLTYSYFIKRNGKVIRKSRERIGHSFVKQFIQLLYISSSAIRQMSMKDINGSDRNIGFKQALSSTGSAAAITVSTLRLIVGTGDTAVAMDDFYLETVVVDGTGAGQLQYGTTVFGAAATDATGTNMRVTRNFNNNSGSSITIKEIGMTLVPTDHTGGTSTYLIARDILDPVIEIANGDELTINYNIKTTI